MRIFTSVAFFLVVTCATVITLACLSYNYGIGAVSDKKEDIEFSVESGNTYLSIAPLLKEKNPIRSEFFYKIYIKIFKPTNLQAGTYLLNESMGVKKIVEALGKGNNSNPNVVTVTIPEGRQIEYVAELFAEKTNNTKGTLLALWNSDEFINKVIEKYDFITEEVKDKDIRYALEGYFFPSTYDLQNKDVDGEYIAYKMLDQMDKILNQFNNEIKNSKHSVHELLTMASIVEYEAIKDEDRPMIAGVFYNRLELPMRLQSCATVGYAIGEWKLRYSTADLEVNSPYNTYMYDGLPPGPGNLPGEKSIEAAIKPTSNDYIFFLADVCHDGYGEDNKVYYSKNLYQHNAYKNQYLTCQ